ncbi:unnamed protein product [Ceutorhynchus assimilis]|uniref:TLC domain-containing protein n=1 Tax=Ceutorhynchus assimilis TaxID=467358 RepID=A0A9N9MEN4_9CUCU|nr:unnamed protein product [Ceutorhynchus assimilis]
MLISAVTWRLIYVLLRAYLKERPPLFSCRICSFIHGFVAAFMGINQCFLFDWPFEHPEWKTSYLQTFILNMSWGYFIHDTFWMLKYEREDKTMMCHHLICIFALTRIIFKGYSGAQTTCALGCMELTNPFLQIRWFLRTYGFQSAPVFYSTEISFFLVFIVVRLILGTYFLTVIVKQPNNDWDFIFMSVAIYAVSWMFVFTMVKYFFKKYVGRDQLQPNQTSIAIQKQL